MHFIVADIFMLLFETQARKHHNSKPYQSSKVRNQHNKHKAQQQQ